MGRPVRAGATTRVVALPAKNAKGLSFALVKMRIAHRIAAHARILRVAAIRTTSAEVPSDVSMGSAMLIRRRDAAFMIRTVQPAFFVMHPLCVHAVRMIAHRPAAYALSLGPVASATKSVEQRVCVLQMLAK